RVEALRSIAGAPAAPGAELRRIVERLRDEDERRAALQAVIPALAPEDVNEVLGPAPGLGGMDHTAPHLTRAQALRVLDAARGRPARGLDCDGFGALLVRVAELGDPAGALARLADVEYVWELDRGKMVARLA